MDFYSKFRTHECIAKSIMTPELCMMNVTEINRILNETTFRISTGVQDAQISGIITL